MNANDDIKKSAAGGMTLHRIGAIRTWLREEGSAEDVDADPRRISRETVSEEVGERLGMELIKEVGKEDMDIGKVKDLINNGADVNLESDDNRTALIEASRNGWKEVVEILISNGAEVNLQAKDGRTALTWAALKEHKEVVEMLIHNGAKTDLRDSLGLTPVDYTENKDIKKLLEDAAER